MNEDSLRLVAEVLESWQFPILENDGSTLLFRYQLNYIRASASTGDDPFVTLSLPNFFEVTTDVEREAVQRICNAINYRMMQVKAYYDEDMKLTIAFEFFYDNPGSVEYQMRRGLSSITSAKREFARLLREERIQI